MDWLVSLLGLALVALALRDVFHTLWHPTRHGGFSRRVMTAMWRLSHRVFPRRPAAGLVGPLAMVIVVCLWALAVVIGCAVVYWPHMPEGFSFSSALEPSEHGGFLDSLYISLVTVATLGLGDIAPAVGWLRVVAPLEALIGFVLLTATVSWVLEIYPALTRRRALALRLAQLHRVDPSPQQMDSDTGARILDRIASDIAGISVDFMQYGESYYFHDGEDRTSLAVMVHYADELARRGSDARSEEVRFTAAVLRHALQDLAVILDQRFLHVRGDAEDVFTAYAADHGRSRPTR